MGIEIVEGVLDPAQPKRIKRGYALFPELAITTPSGERRAFAKVATGEPVTSEVLAGGAGRFCFQRSGGALGLVGVRRPDGQAAFGYFTNIVGILTVVGVLGTLFTVARFGFAVEGLPLTPAVLGPLLLAGAWYINSQKQAARRAFEDDAG